MQDIWNKVVENFMPWMSDHGWKILGIILGAYLVTKFGKIVIDRLIRRVILDTHFSSREAEKKREDTLIAVFYSTIKIIVWLTTIIIILSELGINTAPIMASAGIIGIALGFGGQYLIKDIITGFFIIMENQYRVGDIVTIDGATGTVENINLRMTILRDVDGTVHYIPNGIIEKTSNLTKTLSKVNLDIGVSYDTDINKLEKVVNKMGDKIIEEEGWDKLIKTPPRFVRILSFDDSAITIRISCETKPSMQWDVEGELRRRIKELFEKEKIEIPYPHMVVKK